MNHHLRIDNLQAHFVPDGSATTLMLALRGLTVVITREGLDEVIAALIPEEPLQVAIVDQPGRLGCLIQLQAMRLGFSARITVGLSPSASAPGAIWINLDQGSRWSPLDRVMLGIAQHNLEKVAAKEPAITRLRDGGYQLDLQQLIRDRLLDSSAPLRWDARLERIEGTDERIEVEFIPMVEQRV